MQRVLEAFRGGALRARAMRSAMLTIVSFGGQNALRLGSNLVLTRILFPEAFGLMALVSVFIIGLQMFSDLGIKTAVIRSSRSGDQQFLDTAWTIQILRGAALWLCAFALAGPVAIFYDEPQLREILPIVAIGLIFGGLSSINIAVLNRDLVLGRLTFLELGTQFFGILAMIALAPVLQSVWALVIGGLIHTSSHALLSHIILPGRLPRIRIELAAFYELFHFGKWIFASTISSFLMTHGDRAILGKYITLSELAFYNIAFMLATIPYALSSSLAQRIIFPLYCNKPPAQNPENRVQILRARLFLTSGLLALSTPLVVFANEIVEFLYDPRYYSAGPIAFAIGIVSMVRIVTVGHPQILLATGHARNYAMLLTGNAALRTGLMLVGASHYGVSGVICAFLLSEILFYPITVFCTYRHRAMDWRQDAAFSLFVVLVIMLSWWRNPAALSDFLALAR